MNKVRMMNIRKTMRMREGEIRKKTDKEPRKIINNPKRCLLWWDFGKLRMMTKINQGAEIKRRWLVR
ncbi:hypothetical protein [Pajaroellobacter abortibovis]|nr:hypothetical protein [Pajaroellobacter abortibovis]